MCLKTEKFTKKISKSYYIKKRVYDLGITDNYIGYYYLIDILDIIINKQKSIRCFSKEVYPNLAEKYNTNDCTIERNIRNIIKVNWEINLKHKLKNFWRDNSRPTCCKFIYIVKNYVLSDLA